MVKSRKYKALSSKASSLLGVLLMMFAIFSCSQTKYVPDGEYLLTENEIIIKSDSIQTFNLLSKKGVSEEDLQPIIKQKPNRKILIGKFHLWLYNRANPEKIERKVVKKQEKVDRKNRKIEAKNEAKKLKDPAYEEKPLKERKSTFGEKLQVAGEEPVILDSTKVRKTSSQMSLYLIKKGYFNNVVQDSIVLFDQQLDKNGDVKRVRRKLRQKAKVVYTVVPNLPYVIRNYKRSITDAAISKELSSLKIDSIVRTGQNFDTDKLEEERNRITKHLLNNGFYLFNKEFIYFKVDSTLGERKVDISLGIQNFKYEDMSKDTVLNKPHQKFTYSQVIIYPDYQPKDDEYTKYAELELDSVLLKHKYKLKIKPSLLVNSVLFKKGQLYKKSLVDATYKKLMALGNFRAVNIKIVEDERTGTIVAKVYLEVAKAQTFNVASDGTHTNGLFGVEGSMTYTHSNVFGGAERLQISVGGGLEMQRLIFASDSTDGSIGEEVSNVSEIANTFNTVEFGPKVSLSIHRMLFIQPLVEKLVRQHLSNPKTDFSASLNFQRRPDFKRSIEEFSFGWIYHEEAPMTVRFNPLILSAVSIEKSDAFQQRIDELNDRFLAASYQDHIIGGGKLSFVYNGQDDKHVRNTFYVQSSIETAGNILRGVYNLTNKPFDDPALESYNLLNIRFAQFAKISADLRYYLPVGLKGKIVYRLAGGVGKPLANLKEALPFEKSFFSGGSNGIRAWKARTLGPGSYQDPQLRYDKIGDIQLEGNIEARFPLISWVEGALFVDAGNIWLINEDSLRVGGQFDKSRFISEIGIGAGFGLRFDLDFFVIRLDMAMPVRNPSLPTSDRWIWEGGLSESRRTYYKAQFNLGIGYPF